MVDFKDTDQFITVDDGLPMKQGVATYLKAMPKQLSTGTNIIVINIDAKPILDKFKRIFKIFIYILFGTSFVILTIK